MRTVFGSKLHSMSGPILVALIGCSLASQVSPASAVEFQGLTHTPTGNASLTVIDVKDSLRVDNTGPLNSLFGVDINVEGAIRFSYDDIPTEPVPTGAFMRQKVRGTVDGVPNRHIGSLQVVQMGGDTVEVRAEFDSLLSAGIRIRAFRNDTLVFDSTSAASGPVMSFLREEIGPGHKKCGYWWKHQHSFKMGPPYCHWHFVHRVCLNDVTSELRVTLLGRSFLVDSTEIGEVENENSKQVTYTSNIELEAMGIPRFTITNERRNPVVVPALGGPAVVLVCFLLLGGGLWMLKRRQEGIA